MEFPTLSEVRNDFSKVIENLEFLIETLSTKDDLSFSEYLAQRGTINIELIKLQGKINGLIAADSIRKIKETGSLRADKKYTKAFEGLRQIIAKMVLETDDIEKKHSKDRFLSWEYIYKQGKMRKDLINHFRDVSKRLAKIQKSI